MPRPAPCNRAGPRVAGPHIAAHLPPPPPSCSQQLSDNITTGVEGLGYCVRQPVGGTKGVLQYLQARVGVVV